MDILQIFKVSDQEFPVNVIGTVRDPLFQANQVGALLGIKQIRSSIAHYDDTMKVTKIIGRKKVVFLTEFGLFRIICRSRKPAAREMQKWVYNVIKQIRLTGSYTLSNQNEPERLMLSNCQ